MIQSIMIIVRNSLQMTVDLNGSQTFAKSTNKLRKEFLIATIEDRPVTETLKNYFSGLILLQI